MNESHRDQIEFRPMNYKEELYLPQLHWRHLPSVESKQTLSPRWRLLGLELPMASTTVVASVGVACLPVLVLLSKYSSRVDKLDNASEDKAK